MPRSREQPTVPLTVFQANLLRHLDYSGKSVNAWATQYDLVQSTCNRIMKGKLDPACSQIEKIASKLGYEPWQMMVPGFDPANPPQLLETDLHTTVLLRNIQLLPDDVYKSLSDWVLEATAKLAETRDFLKAGFPGAEPTARSKRRDELAAKIAKGFEADLAVPPGVPEDRTNDEPVPHSKTKGVRSQA